MSVEKIIQQIKKDSEEEIKKIIDEARKQASDIIKKAKEEAKAEAKKIILEGKRKGEALKKAMIAKAKQENKKAITKVKEELINKCFTDAYHKISKLRGKEYEEIVKGMIREGERKLGKNCKIIITREEDKKIVDEMGLTVAGKTNASGGIVLRSSDDKIIIDYTFDSILERNKEKLRIEVGRILFS